jgi:hypothetical protein
MSKLLLDRAGRRRSPATKPGFHAGRSPANKACTTRLTRPPSRRSSPSCARLARARTASGFEG